MTIEGEDYIDSLRREIGAAASEPLLTAIRRVVAERDEALQTVREIARVVGHEPSATKNILRAIEYRDGASRRYGELRRLVALFLVHADTPIRFARALVEIADLLNAHEREREGGPRQG